MNRNYDNDNRSRKNHYADFDAHGNPLTGNRNSLSRHEPTSRYGSFGQQSRSHFSENFEQRYRPGNRASNATRAYGDMNRGTRYGEGGSYEGGGSSYGHSYYGVSGNQGPGISQHDRNWDESKQYNAYGDSDHLMNRNYGNSFGHSRDGGYINDNRNSDNRDFGNYGRDSYRDGYGNTGRENTGYNRGYNTFGNTGYGSTGYNNWDEDRERGAYGSQRYSSENRDYRSEDDRFYNERNQRQSRYGREYDR